MSQNKKQVVRDLQSTCNLEGDTWFAFKVRICVDVNPAQAVGPVGKRFPAKSSVCAA